MNGRGRTAVPSCQWPVAGSGVGIGVDSDPDSDSDPDAGEGPNQNAGYGCRKSGIRIRKSAPHKDLRFHFPFFVQQLALLSPVLLK
jgi:hypothetical protein